MKLLKNKKENVSILNRKTKGEKIVYSIFFILFVINIFKNRKLTMPL